MNLCHEDKRLDTFKRNKTIVKITFFDGRTETGNIYRDCWDHETGRYAINNCHFYKSHVKKIEVVWW